MNVEILEPIKPANGRYLTRQETYINELRAKGRNPSLNTRIIDLMDDISIIRSQEIEKPVKHTEFNKQFFSLIVNILTFMNLLKKIVSIMKHMKFNHMEKIVIIITLLKKIVIITNLL